MRQIPYGKHYIDKSDIAEVIKVLKSDWITQGPKVYEFEKALARYCGVRFAVAVSSGTAALHLACIAIGLDKGSEAITTPITFLATPNSVMYADAKPIFADIDYETANIDPAEIENKINYKTKAILPVHFAGHPCDMPKIYKIAKKNGLSIIEDACHALGAKSKSDNGKWVKVGSCMHSDMAIFSFHPVKHITTGEGGAITTNSKKLYDKICMLRTHGIYRNKKNSKKIRPWYYEMKDLGFNYRITDFQCALGISQLRKLDSFIRRRRDIFEIYEKEFKGNKYFELPQEKNYAFSSWHLYPIRLKDNCADKRRRIFKKLQKSGIGVQVHYIPVYTQPYYQKTFAYKLGDFPIAENYYSRALSLPIYPKMNKAEVRYVVKCAKDLIQ
jgi:UDP-4-amino-4,6-dideoxy-N-acetyl-beta-L-altrosamine transaminase